MRVRIKKRVRASEVRYYVQYSRIGLFWKDFDWSTSFENTKEYARALLSAYTKPNSWEVKTIEDIDQLSDGEDEGEDE